MIKIAFLVLLSSCSPAVWLDFVRGEEQVAEKLIQDELGQVPASKPQVKLNP